MFASLLVIAMLAAPARADTLSLQVRKSSGKELFTHDFVDAEDGEVFVHSKGKWSWTATLQRMDYDGETRVCVDVLKLHPKKGTVDVGRPCIVVPTDETPSAEVRTSEDKLELVLGWTG